MLLINYIVLHVVEQMKKEQKLRALKKEVKGKLNDNRTEKLAH
jgi:hypothetical protein